MNNNSNVIPPDQSMLDDIEKTLNDDMKRIISWLQQLKYVKPLNFSHIVKNELLWSIAQTEEFHFESYKYYTQFITDRERRESGGCCSLVKN